MSSCVHIRIIHNSPRGRCLAVRQENGQTKCGTSVYTTEYQSIRKRKEVRTHAVTWMNPQDSTLREIAHHRKTNIFIYMRYLEQANSQKVEQTFPGTGKQREKWII